MLRGVLFNASKDCKGMKDDNVQVVSQLIIIYQYFFIGEFMRIFGIVILIVGLVVLGFGINSSQAVGEKVVEGLSGRFTSNTMWYIIGGIALIVGGGAL